MEKNSPTFSHRTFWFLWGIEERVKWNVNTISGEFNQMFLRHPLPRSNRSNPKDYLEPNSIVFIGTQSQLSAILPRFEPDRLFLYGGAGYVPCAILDLKPIRASTMCRVANKVCLLDIEHRSLAVVDLRFSAIEGYFTSSASLDQGAPPSTISVEALDHQIFSLVGIEADEDTRLVAWESDASILRLLAWQRGTSKAWTANVREKVARFAETDLGLSRSSFDRLEIADICYHRPSRSLFLTDCASGRLVCVGVDDSCLEGAAYAEKRTQELRIEDGGSTHLKNPCGVAIYELSEPEDRPYTNLFELIKRREKAFAPMRESSSQKSQRIELLGEHAFVVVVDPSAELAVTVGTASANARVLPLVGEFSSKSLRRTVDNLAIQRLRSASNVTRGPNGSLLFSQSLQVDNF